MPVARGTFEITMTPEPPYDQTDTVTLSRARLEKRFTGALEGTSVVHMLSAVTAIPKSAGYVALERIEGTLEGRRGSFVVVHTGIMSRGEPSLTIAIVPDSGDGELLTIAGSMRIEITGDVHHYVVDYTVGGQ